MRCEIFRTDDPPFQNLIKEKPIDSQSVCEFFIFKITGINNGGMKFGLVQ